MKYFKTRDPSFIRNVSEGARPAQKSEAGASSHFYEIRLQKNAGEKWAINYWQMHVPDEVYALLSCYDASFH